LDVGKKRLALQKKTSSAEVKERLYRARMWIT